MSDVTNLQPVGEGAWGKVNLFVIFFVKLKKKVFETYFKVYKAKWQGPVAVKKLKCENQIQDQIKGFQQEVNMLRICRHENIVLFMSYILDPPLDMCIVMHWCASSLYKLIHVKKDSISVHESLRIARETAQASFISEIVDFFIEKGFWELFDVFAKGKVLKVKFRNFQKVNVCFKKSLLKYRVTQFELKWLKYRVT